MTKDEMQAILADHLAKFRTWSYAQLAERVSEHGGFLEHAEGVGADGTACQMEFNATWDDKTNGDVSSPTSLPSRKSRCWASCPSTSPTSTTASS